MYSKKKKYLEKYKVALMIMIISLLIVTGLTLAIYNSYKDNHIPVSFGKVQINTTTPWTQSVELKNVVSGTRVANALYFSKSFDSESMYVRAKMKYSLTTDISALPNEDKATINTYVDNLNSMVEYPTITSSMAWYVPEDSEYAYLVEGQTNVPLIVNNTNQILLSRAIIIPYELTQLEDRLQYMLKLTFDVEIQAVQSSQITQTLLSVQNQFRVVFENYQNNLDFRVYGEDSIRDDNEAFNGLYCFDYGTYPQSKVIESVLVNKLNGLVPTGEKIRLDIAGHSTLCDIYYYNSHKYVRIDNGQISYYKFEPITWLVLGYQDGTNLPIKVDALDMDKGIIVLSEDILSGLQYNYAGLHTAYLQDGSSVQTSNDWARSEIRAILNNTNDEYCLYDTFFTHDEKEYISSVNLSSTFSYTNGSTMTFDIETKDKLFLLGSQPDNNNTALLDALVAKSTPLALATGVQAQPTEESSWWLRTGSGNDPNSACVVNYDGTITQAQTSQSTSTIGFRPAFIYKTPSAQDDEPIEDEPIEEDDNLDFRIYGQNSIIDDNSLFNGLYCFDYGKYPQERLTDGRLANEFDSIYTPRQIRLNGEDYPYFVYEGSEYIKFNSTEENNASNPSARGWVYYKYEPVTWLIISYGEEDAFGTRFEIDTQSDTIIFDTTVDISSGLLVISEKVLFQQIYSSPTSHEVILDDGVTSVQSMNDWKNSELRQTMNGSLLNTLFTTEQQTKINSAEVKTSLYYDSTPNTALTTTTDKLFLLGVEQGTYGDNYKLDILNNALNNSNAVSVGQTYTNLLSKPTAFALASGVTTNVTSSTLTRTASNVSNGINYIDYNGNISTTNVDNTALGIRPAFVLDVEDISENYSNNFIYSGNTVTGLTDEGRTKSVLKIPSTYKSYGSRIPVKSIGSNAFSNRTNIVNITIPEGVTSIGSSAFNGCSSLTEIRIPNSVTSIGSYVFDSCSSLVNANIPDGVTSIGNYTFNHCRSLISIIIPDGVTSIGRNAFYGCRGLMEIRIPSSVTSMGNFAFDSCYKLVHVRNLSKIELAGIPSSIPGQEVKTDNTQFSADLVEDGKYITYAINGKKYVMGFTFGADKTSVNITDDINVIYDYAFYGCSSVESITISDNVVGIGVEAFHYTSWYNAQPNGLMYIGKVLYCHKGPYASVTSVTVKEGTKGIGGKAFYCYQNLRSISFPNGLITIGSYAFQQCSSLSSVTIPESVTDIGCAAFYYCSGIRSINIPAGVTCIRSTVFGYCPLTSVTIPEGVTSIEGWAFGATNLSNVTIPSAVKSIGMRAFYNCSNLRSVTFANTNGWKVGSTTIDVTNPTTNASRFNQSNYYLKVWTRG